MCYFVFTGVASTVSSKESSSKESSSEDSSSKDTWHNSASTAISSDELQRAFLRAPRSRVRERARGDPGSTRERGGRDGEQMGTGSSARETKGIGKQRESQSESEQDAEEEGYVVLDVLILPVQAFGD